MWHQVSLNIWEIVVHLVYKCYLYRTSVEFLLHLTPLFRHLFVPNSGANWRTNIIGAYKARCQTVSMVSYEDRLWLSEFLWHKGILCHGVYWDWGTISKDSPRTVRVTMMTLEPWLVLGLAELLCYHWMVLGLSRLLWSPISLKSVAVPGLWVIIMYWVILGPNRHHWASW